MKGSPAMTDVLWPLVYNVIRRNKFSNTIGVFAERASGGHWGRDFYAPKNTPCYAIADGDIAAIFGTSADTESFGLVVVLKFKYEHKTLYAAYCPLQKATVILNQKAIAAGDEIGYTGNSGNAFNMTGEDEHLHFEIRESVRPPPGSFHRLSPIKVFKTCPLHLAVVEP